MAKPTRVSDPILDLSEQPPFRFLDLPAELRCIIYEYTLGGEIVKLRLNHGGSGVTIQNLRKTKLSLLLVCRQIYKEAHLIFFEENIFMNHDPEIYDSVNVMNEFLLGGSQARLQAVTTIATTWQMDFSNSGQGISVDFVHYAEWTRILRNATGLKRVIVYLQFHTMGLIGGPSTEVRDIGRTTCFTIIRNVIKLLHEKTRELRPETVFTFQVCTNRESHLIHLGEDVQIRREFEEEWAFERELYFGDIEMSGVRVSGGRPFSRNRA
ncbi:hypothetical protein GQ44DRAFT_707555 [Phaeosphaeriaceae sp. PMI808]|nr:hypothetical protein GQ44DRAFT_707555 [Phaeosphaeriaceae sp. PMI808]